MLKSTKVKYFGITGTIILIALSYTLSANTFYKDIYRDDTPFNKIKNKKVLVKKEKKVTQKERVTSENILNIKKTLPIVQTPLKKVEDILKSRGYITFDNSGDISDISKETLNKLSPLFIDMKDVYIEIEGYSLSLENQDKTQIKSLEYAQKVYVFLSKKNIDKRLFLTGYGDMYPVSDDNLDSKNSRVELKIRRR